MKKSFIYITLLGSLLSAGTFVSTNVVNAQAHQKLIAAEDIPYYKVTTKQKTKIYLVSKTGDHNQAIKSPLKTSFINKNNQVTLGREKGLDEKLYIVLTVNGKKLSTPKNGKWVIEKNHDKWFKNFINLLLR